MEIQLDELLGKIKSEGVDRAEEQAQKVVSDAQSKATAITEQAKKEAARIVSEAEQRAAKTEQAGQDALAQAARDLILNVQAKLKVLFQEVVSESVREAYSGKTLESAIVALVSASRENEIGNLSVQVPKNELDSLEKGLRDRLAKQIEKGMTIEPAQGLESGFRLAKKDGGAYYDFSSENIATILAEYVSPRLAEHLRNTMQGA